MSHPHQFLYISVLKTTTTVRYTVYCRSSRFCTAFLCGKINVLVGDAYWTSKSIRRNAIWNLKTFLEFQITPTMSNPVSLNYSLLSSFFRKTQYCIYRDYARARSRSASSWTGVGGSSVGFRFRTWCGWWTASSTRASRCSTGLLSPSSFSFTNTRPPPIPSGTPTQSRTTSTMRYQSSAKTSRSRRPSSCGRLLV